MSEKNKYEKVMEVSKRRGFIWPSFELYGGEAGFYDFGPLGSLLKNNLLQKWRRYYVVKEGCLEIDSPTVFPKSVLKASGHVDHFTDMMAECKSCGKAFELTEVIEDQTGMDVEGRKKDEIREVMDEEGVKCPKCDGSFGEIFDFNTMFPTQIGPKGDTEAFLRPETAQSIFVDFNRLQRAARRQLPFGVAQIGKGYRNEISPRKGVIRLREFTMAEAEVFFDPEDPSHPKFERVEDVSLSLWLAEGQEKENEELTETTAGDGLEDGLIINQLMAYHLAFAKKFILDIGIPDDKIRFREQVPGERAHYSEETWDLEVYTENFGWIEIAGFAYRKDYDLSRHSDFSGEDMTVFYQESGEEEGRKVLPHVVEPSFGVDRVLYSVIEHSFVEGEDKEYFKFEKDLAPTQASVFPLISDDGLPEKADEILESLKDSGVFAEYDDSGSIGKRYARSDEIGVPYCITVDHQTLEDSTVTVRDRDSTEQIRVDIEDLPQRIKGLLNDEIEFEEAGEPV